VETSKKKLENGYSFYVEFRFDDREANAVAHYWSDFTFYLERGDGWGVIPEKGYGGAALVDGKHAPGGRFIEGVWKGIIYPNGIENIPNIDDAIKILSDSVNKHLNALLECFDAAEKYKA
jgi:hypothetical protein